MIIEAPPLTHRFTALYTDGTSFVQPMNDASATQEGKSAYTDVDQERVQCFFLESADHLFMVDLRDGHFEIDNVRFHMGPDEPLVGQRHLVFFRRVAHSKRSTMTGEIQATSVHRHYQLGWELDGVVRTIAVGFEVFHG